MTELAPIHPDDVIFFHDVRKAMFAVARRYKLPLETVTVLPMPASSMADRMGDCDADGHVRIVLRCTVDGEWCANPMSPDEVWDTAAHELAHLKYLQHGTRHHEFGTELRQALRNQVEDHRDKVIARLVKMQACRDGEAALGNAEAAEAFAGAINRMLLEHELNPSDIDYARAADNDPVIEVPVNFDLYKIEEKKQRIAWQETLAQIVARAHLCRFLIRTGSNYICFVGTKSHAVVAEYAYGVLVPAAERLATKAYDDYWKELRRTGQSVTKARGFRSTWLTAFVERIGERFDEARKAAVAVAPEGTSTALVRLAGALQKAQRYVDDKFAGRRRAAGLYKMNYSHADGLARGRAAADGMAIGRRGVGSGQRLLKE